MLDAFTSYDNQQRPHRSHRSLPHPATPATARAARPKAAPGDRASDRHQRVRIDRVDAHGKLTLRHSGRLHHIGTGGRACPAAAGLGQQGVNGGQAPARVPAATVLRGRR